MRSRSWYLHLQITRANIPEMNDQTKDETPKLTVRRMENANTSMRTHLQKSKRRFSVIHPTDMPRTVLFDCLRDAVSNGVENSRSDDLGRDGVGLFVNRHFPCTSIRLIYQLTTFPMKDTIMTEECVHM